jgi:UDP-2,3-diacylglucosamine pyrophosphatase LpxH
VATECSAGPGPDLVRRYRAIFISDLHLGTRGCKADYLLDFLRHVESDYLYLVGDIVDGWRLEKRWFWPPKHAQILARLLDRARRGTRVIYLPGNHDERLRALIGQDKAGIQFQHEVIHETADGRRLLVVHGDHFDAVVTDMKWLALIGSAVYDVTVALNTAFNRLRAWVGLGYWPLAGVLKRQVKAAVNFIEDFERALCREARSRQLCGVVCGHIHKPEMRTIEGVLYLNDGDWVESCSALVEHQDGRLELLDWARQRRPGVLPPPPLLADQRGKTAAAA